jgi:hypothetical protein
MSDSTAAACWICLDDGPDDAGKPTVRDCSCRGSDAGFAHISCIVEYATRKSLENSDNNNYVELGVPWMKCPNCNQCYTGQLRDELVGKFVEFTENQYSDHDWHRLPAYGQMLGTVGVNDHDEAVAKCIYICDKLENGEFDPLLIHPADIKRLISMTYRGIGITESYRGINEQDENSAKKGIRYLERSRDLEKEMGDTTGALLLEAQISSFTSGCIKTFGPGFGKTARAEESLENFRAIYESCIDQDGEASADSIICGMNYAIALLGCGHMIKAWRLLNKLIPLSQQIHGSEHKQTLNLQKLFDKVHLVVVRNQDNDVFRALRYEGDQCVVQGPIRQPRIFSAEKVLKVTVHDDNIMLSEGTPVICHGLKNEEYLNGKIGECRGFDKDATEIRYRVLFDDKSIPPKSVKPENLRILFELPETTEG